MPSLSTTHRFVVCVPSSSAGPPSTASPVGRSSRERVGVLLRDQLRDRHVLHERRIAEHLVARGERAAPHLDEPVDVLGRVPAELREVDAAQHVRVIAITMPPDDGGGIVIRWRAAIVDAQRLAPHRLVAGEIASR